MQVARFWATEKAVGLNSHGVEVETSAWGWSSDSLEEAQARAKATAASVVHWIVSDDDNTPPRQHEYQYLLDRPPREQLIEEFRDEAGETVALISRNKYGSLVLNCRDLMFVDVDFPSPSFWRVLWCKFRGQPALPTPEETAARERVQLWRLANRQYSTRLYETAAGLRLVIVDRMLSAESEESRKILRELGSDPLYQMLCQTQSCFRARLSPKPWRIGVAAPPKRFPFFADGDEDGFRQWIEAYEQASATAASCKLIDVSGPPRVDPALASLLELHDTMTKANFNLPLA
ncbi:hypothetical protein [Lacipirellula sp.]|uniref:hypothetical protein n=1 Tax=Lacipirellula sp. TaxID=2691419 RepID=UPI003D0E4ACB